ncbi:MAG: hypothetical protein KAX49_10785 [Halanaerobiales bacterium]|nr:hypothetical protein [Halanaerobiales bacterium]
MRKYKFTIILLMIFCTLFIISSCTSKSEQSSPKSENSPKPIPPEIEEMESTILKIMNQVDLVPYYEKQIKEKKLEEKEQKEILTAKEDGTEKKEEEFKPKPITTNDILLSEILKKEKPQEEGDEEKKITIPDDIIFIWHEINTEINSLHDKWNDLESILLEAKSFPKELTGFKNNLNNLTISSSKYNYLETLVTANRLTSYISLFTKGFKSETPPSIYDIKYHVRQIIIDSAINEYNKVNENFSAIKNHEETIVFKLIEEKSKEDATKLKSSISDLESAISLKDISIIKVKAGVVIKNVTSIKEKLSKK